MSLTDEGLLAEMPHRSAFVGGVQRLYRWGDFGLSVVNSPMLHSYPFAWEAAVIRFENKGKDKFELVYDTGLTNDVEVFSTDEEANEFIAKAAEHFTKREVTR